jgi:hypothetical protein
LLTGVIFALIRVFCGLVSLTLNRDELAGNLKPKSP